MTPDTVKGLFARMGARMQFGTLVDTDRQRRNLPLTLDVRSDETGEFFDIRQRSPADRELAVVDLHKRNRHLLLRARKGSNSSYYLCGHDEQHWFVAAIPERSGE